MRLDPRAGRWWQANPFWFERRYQGLAIWLLGRRVLVLIYPFWKLHPRVIWRRKKPATDHDQGD